MADRVERCMEPFRAHDRFGSDAVSLNYRGNGAGTAVGGCISILATIAALLYVTYDFFDAKDNPEYVGSPSIYTTDADPFVLNGEQHIAFLFLPMNMHNP